MKLAKAIEVLEDILRYVEPGDPPDEHDAVKLGIEAMKDVLRTRKFRNSPTWLVLPGETKE